MVFLFELLFVRLLFTLLAFALGIGVALLGLAIEVLALGVRVVAWPVGRFVGTWMRASSVRPRRPVHQASVMAGARLALRERGLV